MTLKGQGIPLPSLEWVRQKTHVSRAEIEIAGYLGFIEPAGGTGGLPVEHVPPPDNGFGTKVQEKYFLLLLVHLYERWFLIERPNSALENLVLYFKDRESIWIGDKMLPSGVAGMGGSEKTAVANPAEYLRKMRTHDWLSAYVKAAVVHDAFGTPAL